MYHCRSLHCIVLVYLGVYDDRGVLCQRLPWLFSVYACVDEPVYVRCLCQRIPIVCVVQCMQFRGTVQLMWFRCVSWYVLDVYALCCVVWHSIVIVVCKCITLCMFHVWPSLVL